MAQISSTLSSGPGASGSQDCSSLLKSDKAMHIGSVTHLRLNYYERVYQSKEFQFCSDTKACGLPSAITHLGSKLAKSSLNRI